MLFRSRSCALLPLYGRAQCLAIDTINSLRGWGFGTVQPGRLHQWGYQRWSMGFLCPFLTICIIRVDFLGADKSVVWVRVLVEYQAMMIGSLNIPYLETNTARSRDEGARWPISMIWAGLQESANLAKLLLLHKLQLIFLGELHKSTAYVKIPFSTFICFRIWVRCPTKTTYPFVCHWKTGWLCKTTGLCELSSTMVKKSVIFKSLVKEANVKSCLSSKRLPLLK